MIRDNRNRCTACLCFMSAGEDACRICAVLTPEQVQEIASAIVRHGNGEVDQVSALLLGKEDRPYIVAVGEMFDAINFFGPFDSFDAAADWADRNASTGWWVLMLEDPEDH